VLAASLVAAALLSRGGAPIVRWIGRSVGIPDRAGSYWAGAIRDGLLLGMVFHGLSLMLGLALVVAVDRSIAPRSMEVLGALAVARLSLALPITPNGLGVQEGAVAALFVALGLAPDVALASLLLNRLALVTVVLLGGLAMATSPFDKRSAHREAAR
jgi:uncharacterized membrane protein YbhN (UPF0104 family)